MKKETQYIGNDEKETQYIGNEKRIRRKRDQSYYIL